MRILIDIGHPAHVHLFKNFVYHMQGKGHDFIFTCREKEFEIQLLEAYNFNYISFGKKYKTLYGKIFGLIKFNFKMLKTALKFKPDYFLSVGSMYAGQVSFLLRKPHFAMEDTGNMEQIRLYLPFTKTIFTPKQLLRKLGKNQFNYDSFHEIAYLHPNYFKPNEDIYKLLGIQKNKKFVLIRFVAWNATHDIGHGGFTANQKRDMIEYLSNKYEIFITSETNLPKSFKKYKIKIPPEKIHDVMAFADMVISEGATMASEAGIIGTPAIYVNSIRACNNEDLEKYGLVYNFSSGEKIVRKIKELELLVVKKEIFIVRKEKMLNNKIDLTSMLIWYIENYPSSLKTLKENPDYQYKFK